MAIALSVLRVRMLKKYLIASISYRQCPAPPAKVRLAQNLESPILTARLSSSASHPQRRGTGRGQHVGHARFTGPPGLLWNGGLNRRVIREELAASGAFCVYRDVAEDSLTHLEEIGIEAP